MIEVEAGGFNFLVREDSSDLMAVRDVIERRQYARYGNVPGEGEDWIDGGANIGAFSVWAASHGARVQAFEPDPEMAAMARENVRRNGFASRVEVYDCGLWHGDETTTMTLFVNSARRKFWRSSVVKQWRGAEQRQVLLVPIEPFWTPDMHVKLDIEGSEFGILQRYAGERVARLIFECSYDMFPELGPWRGIRATLSGLYDHSRGWHKTVRERPEVLAWPKSAMGNGNGGDLVFNWDDEGRL